MDSPLLPRYIRPIEEHRHKMHISPDAEVEIIRALLRWGETKCFKSYTQLKLMNIPFVSHVLAATESIAGRIGIQTWLESVAECCNPLADSMDKYLAHHLLSAIEISVENVSHEKDENESELKCRIKELQEQVEDVQVKWFKEKCKSDTLEHELDCARYLQKESMAAATKKMTHLEEELNRCQTESKENSLRAWGTISELEEQLTAFQDNQAWESASECTTSDRVFELEEELSAVIKQRDEAIAENTALKAKLEHTEQKLVWTMMVLSMKKNGNSLN